MLGGREYLGPIAHLVTVLVHDYTHQIVYYFLHIVWEREKDRCELFAESREVSVGRLPLNWFKYVEL